MGVWVSEDITGEAAVRGESAEEAFARLFEQQFGVAPIKASMERDKYGHVDYELNVSGRVSSVDVKALKKEARGCEEVRPDIIWVEWTTSFHAGWLFGEAEYVAFQQADGSFLCVKRVDLLKKCKEVTKHEITTTREMYKLHIRVHANGSVDVITKLPASILNDPSIYKWRLTGRK